MKSGNVIEFQYYQSPCGELVLYSHGGRLCMCNWAQSHDTSSASLMMRSELQADFQEKSSAVIRQAMKQLDAYFERRRRELKLPLLLLGTEFQKRVWTALPDIPYGHTITYGELARRLGIPTATRAVANACGENVLSLFLPCHRVLGKGGDLYGYSGGLDVKRYLLDLEDNTLFMPEPPRPTDSEKQG